MLSKKFFNRKQASPVEGESLWQKEEKRRKRKGEKKFPKIEKPKEIGHFQIGRAHV